MRNEIGLEAYKQSRKQSAAYRFRKKSLEAVIYIILTFAAVILLSPILWVFLTAFTPEHILRMASGKIDLSSLSFDNYKMLFANVPVIGLWFFNTLYISIIVTVVTVIINSLSGYSFAKLKFTGRSLIFWLLLTTLMIPAQLTVIPLFIIFTNILHLKDTHLAVILPQFSTPIGIFLMRQYIRTIPSDFEDSARIDGCSEFQIYYKVILPMIKPIIAVWSIFIFIENWKNFFWPLIILEKQDLFLLEIGISMIQRHYFLNQGMVMAGASIAILPVLVIFVFFQKHLSHGIAIGELK